MRSWFVCGWSSGAAGIIANILNNMSNDGLD